MDFIWPKGCPCLGITLCQVLAKTWDLYFEDFVVVAWEPGSCKVAGLEPCANVWAFRQCK